MRGAAVSLLVAAILPAALAAQDTSPGADERLLAAARDGQVEVVTVPSCGRGRT